MAEEEETTLGIKWVGMIIILLIIIVIAVAIILLMPEGAKAWLADFLYWVPGVPKAIP